MILPSEEMRGAIDVNSELLGQLEDALIARASEFTASEFSMICNSVKEDSEHLDKFLSTSQSQVKSWLHN